MERTTEHIGKVAHMAGNLQDFIGGGSASNFGNAGITYIGAVQIGDSNGITHTFAEIIGDCDPDQFTEILTKAEANEKILSYFVPTITITVSDDFFYEYVRRFVPDELFASLPADATDIDILTAMKNAGHKFITMTEYEGPLFPID